MRIEIVPNDVAAVKPEKVLRLKAVTEPDGSFTLISLNSKGQTNSYLLSISTAGKLQLFEQVSPKLGLQLDKNGRLKIFRG